jgi:putative cell wall-binding protein
MYPSDASEQGGHMHTAGPEDRGGRGVRRLVAPVLAAAFLLIAASCSNLIITEIEEGSRYGTAAALAAEAFPDGAHTVLLATGRSFADALAAAPLAHQREAPILLTEPDEVPEDTLDALGDLGVDEVLLLGGPGAISEEVHDQLTSEGYQTTRLAGPDRAATAARLADLAFPDSAEVALLANGRSFADALAAAPFSTARGAPILLTGADELPAPTRMALSGLGVQRVVLLGGTAAIGEGVGAQLEADGLQVSRTAGDDRFETAALLARSALPDGAETAILVTGVDFPDALAAAPLAESLDAPILLTGADGVPEATMEVLGDLGVNEVLLLGGTAAIGESVDEQLSDAEYEVRRLPE